jgi:hypothetical protein
MSMRSRAILVIAICSGTVSAASLASLVPQSDVIVVGMQSDLAQAGTRGATFSITVERVFQGNVAVGSLLPVTWDGAHGTGVAAGSTPQHGIWFLRQGTGGSWLCIPSASLGNLVLFADLPLPISGGALPAGLAYDPATTSVTDQLVLEVAATQPRNPSLILWLTGALSSAAVSQAFRYLAGNQSGDFQLAGMTGLIGLGDAPTLLQVEQTAATIDFTSSSGQLLASIIRSGYLNPDPTGVASLGRMATSGTAPPQLQQAAANALRTIHTPSAVPYLGLLLSSASQQIQLYAAQGIAWFVDGVGIPTPQTVASMSYLGSGQQSAYYTTDTQQHIGWTRGQEPAFIAYWQNWWQQHPALHTIN